MKDRIQIDGVWYIKEEETKEPLDINYYYEAVYEDNLFCIKASVVIKDEPPTIDKTSLSFEVTDKRQKPWVEDNWDNIEWFQYLSLRERKNIDYVKSIVGDDGLKIVLSMIDELKEKGWF